MKLVAKKDFEIYNVFQAKLNVKKGQVFEGTEFVVNDNFIVVTINILGEPTPFDMDVVKQFFEIGGQYAS